MAKQILFINGTNVVSNRGAEFILRASNPFILGLSYLKAIKDIHVEKWLLVNNEGEGGNSGMNAGAYLCETLEEMSGLDLA